MVYLYGVTHGSHWNNSLFGPGREIELRPTKELIEDLSTLPKGTQIGLESLTQAEWEEINVHLWNLPFNPPEPRFEDQLPFHPPSYERGTPKYWETVAAVCLEKGLEVVFLEDKNIWFRYNELLVRTVENEAKRRNLLVKEEGETEEEYDRKRVGFNIDRTKEIIASRKVHEIERDNALLKAIKESGVNVAVVGLAHSDYWMHDPQAIQTRFGINFKEYSIESAKFDRYGRCEQSFSKVAMVGRGHAFGRESLERAIRLNETGKISDNKPDYFGTWDVHDPFRGYFEMFVDRKGKKISGQIVDCLGDADFIGEIDKGEMHFIKRYIEGECLGGAVLSPIKYDGLVRENGVVGFFTTGGFGQSFYATSTPVKDLIDFSLSWESLAKKYESEVRLFGERLVNSTSVSAPNRHQSDDEDIPF